MQQIALVVDDSRVARMTLSKLLVAHDLDVVELGSGEEALAYLNGENVKPDIIFMDVMMGGMDGLTATQQIKADNNLKHIPIVVCTGHDTDADRAKSLNVGAVATLTKPPKAEALDALIEEITQHITSVSENEVPAPVIDSAALLVELKAMVEQNLLPQMQQELRDITETVSRQVANETAEHRITEQVALLTNTTHEPVAAVDEKALFVNVMTSVEQDLLPKLNQGLREVAEDISRQIATDTAEQIVAEQVQLAVNGFLPTIKEELSSESKQLTEDLANSVAKHAAHDAVANSAEKAVQNAVEEYDVSRQITALLNTEGEAWLQRHEQQVFEQLMQQIDIKFAPMVMNYLNEHLTQMITPIAQAVVEEALARSEAPTEVPINESNEHPELNELNQQISMLKTAVIGLGGMVLVLAVAMIF